MVKEKTREARGLFRSVGTDGSHWLLVILADDGWAITRDGEPIAAGTRDRASLEDGVRQFLSLTLSRVGVGRLPRLKARAARSATGLAPAHRREAYATREAIPTS